MQKTIFITAFFGFSARSILSTKILDILASEPNTRVVVLTSKERQEEYRAMFAGNNSKNVIVEGITVKNPKTTTFKWETGSKSRLEKFFFGVFLNASDTNSLRIFRMCERRDSGRYLASAFHWFLAKLGNLKVFRVFLRLLDYSLLSKIKNRELFEKYAPSLIFATDIFNEHDIQLMREAKSRGARIVGMVRSWDNITSHGLNRIVPDKLIVHTPKIKSEAARYNDIAPEDIFVSGIPHYDRYTAEHRSFREELFKKLNLDPRKKTVFFAPPSDMYTKNNSVSRQVIKELLTLDDTQVLIRLYAVGETDLGGITAISGKIAIDTPPKHMSIIDASNAPQEDAHLADLIYHSDVVVAVASTLAIDAAALGKPVVLIGFDGEPRPYWNSLRRYYDYDHQRYLVDIGGARLADNLGSLMDYVRSYLVRPDLDMSQRKKAMEEFCWKLDGKSGERVGEFLRNELESALTAGLK